MPKIDLVFITNLHAYPALLANPEVHLIGFHDLTPHAQERVKRFTKRKWEKEMQYDLEVERIILQNLADAFFNADKFQDWAKF